MWFLLKYQLCFQHYAYSQFMLNVQQLFYCQWNVIDSTTVIQCTCKNKDLPNSVHVCFAQWYCVSNQIIVDSSIIKGPRSIKMYLPRNTNHSSFTGIKHRSIGLDALAIAYCCGTNYMENSFDPQICIYKFNL